MSQSLIKQFGHPGGLHTTIQTGTTGSAILYLTGSEYGYGAVITQGSFDGYIQLTGGGVVSGSILTDGVVYPLSVGSITPNTTGSIYIFKTKT